MRQQNASTTISNQKSSNRSSGTASSRHGNNSSTSSSAGNSISNHNSSKSNVSGMSNATKTTSSMKHSQGISSASSSNHHSNNNNNNNNNNGLSAIGHNSSPILPMTPTSSVSPPVNVICKKEMNNYHGGSVPAISDIMKTTSIHDNIKEELSMAHTPSAYSNINARLGQGGNLTPLGSNSSIITTPSPPITPSQNALPYMPNHSDTYFWHPQYQQNYNYNPPASYYSQMDYQGQANYSMGHSGYSGSNFGLSSSTTLNNTMSTQAFPSNGIDYMSTQDKYVNGMV